MAREKFTERWVKTLMDSMDAHVDQQTKISLMESCGRTCARECAIRSDRPNLPVLIAELEAHLGD